MWLSILGALLWSSLVSSQNNYSNLAIPFLSTSDSDTPLPNGFPWGTRNLTNTNPYPPITGVTRSYNFIIKRETISPDGYLKNALTINGQFPGPLIEANWGDTIQVTVQNGIDGPEEGTALHWHGLLEKTSQWMDGVPGVTQCPIPPGESFTYTFQADLYGTSWYHSHYSAQYAGGLLGPLIIHGPGDTGYDIDIGPVILTDYYHTDYFTLVEDAVSTNISKAIIYSDNNLINGRNTFNCSTVAAGDTTQCNPANVGLSSFKFTPGKTHRLRLINAGGEGIQKFSIDGHNLTIIANDFVPINSYTTEVVTLGVGQRSDVLVTAPQGVTTESFLMRSTIPGNRCSSTHQGNATAIVYYGSEVPSTTPTTTPWPALADSVANQCANDAISETTPIFPITPDPNPPVTETITIGFGQNETGHWLWTMNNSTFRANYNDPVLLLANSGNDSYPYDREWNVYNFGSNSSIRIHIRNPSGPAHPMHLHGHNFHVLFAGPGPWDGTTITNPLNPQRRDVQILPSGGDLVLQFEADNPGAWPLHCHIAWHVSAGLYVTVLEGPDEVKELEIPDVVEQNCRAWGIYTGEAVVDDVDSGL